MKRILSFLFVIIFTTGALATGIGATDTTASCDNNTLGQTSGTANVEIDWQPNTINIRWYDGENQLNVQNSAQSCVYNDDLYLPNTRPTKTGYTFAGWTVIDVPPGYTELEYIQTTGTQWIDTGIKGNMSYTYEIDFQQTDTGNYRRWGCFGQQSYVGQNMSFTWDGFMVRWEYTNNNDRLYTLASADTNRHVLKIVAGNIYWDGVNKGTTSGHKDNFVINYNLFLGTANPAGTTPANNSHAKYYAYKVWNTRGELIQNFIPARRNNDNVIGMYDTVTGQFFTNSGTGDFIAGPAVLDGYTEIQYLESTGTQYIDTGITTWNNTLEYETKLSIEQQDDGVHTYFGGWNIWTTDGYSAAGLGTYRAYRAAYNFIAGSSSSDGTDIGVRVGQTGIFSIKGNRTYWSEGTSSAFDRSTNFTVSNTDIYLFVVYMIL